MGIGTDDGQYFDSHMEYLISTARGAKADKKFADAKEINTNQQAGDFESRFNAVSSAPTMPPQASTELTGALKSSGSTETPARDVISKLTGSDGGERFQTWPERLARSAFTLPGDVLSGKVQPGSVQEIERAADLASIMVGGPAPVAARMAEGTLGSFAGVKSRTLPKDKLYEAQTMELDMMHPDDIWDKTGFFRGADTRWRYEIPDTNAKLKPEAFDTIIEQQAPDKSKGWTTIDTSTPQGDKIIPKGSERVPTKTIGDVFWPSHTKPLILREVIDHPELFKAYPELGTMKVEPLPTFLEKTGIQGQVSGDTIYLAPGHPEYTKSVLLHEIQHGIQHHEGFAYGGNKEQFLPRELPQAEKEFLKIKSELEPEILKDLSTKFDLKKEIDPGIDLWKNLVRAEKEGRLPESSKELLEKVKTNHPLSYKRLSNIVESERLLQQAQEEAFAKYTRLMGEVEARNVQARLHYDTVQGKSIPPYRTEDIPRFLQTKSPE